MTGTSDSKYGTTSAAVSDFTEFKVCYQSPCCDDTLTTINISNAVATVTDNYSGTDKVFDYGANPYTVTPSICNLSVKCLGVQPSN